MTTTETPRTRVLLADDHAVMLQGLCALLARQPWIEVVGVAADGRAAARLAAELAPDVVVLDVGMPELNGIEAARLIRGVGDRGPRVVALSAHADPRFAAGMLRAGASAYVTKEAAFEELVAALRAVLAGRVYLSPAVSGGLIDDYLAGATADDPDAACRRLSGREREVLQLVAEGRATKEVAHVLFISVKTVETHRRNIMEKLGLRSVAELTKYSLRQGLTSPEPQSRPWRPAPPGPPAPAATD